MFSKHYSSRLALAVAAACASVPAFAQDELEETIITATRTPVALDAVDAPVIVITRQDIERSMATDISEILQGHAGLEIARNGGPGQTTSLFTRGTDSNHTVVLIDGVRINPGTIGGAALQNIAPESLERIEIVKGPRSSLYGTDAIGGVVQLFTRGAAKKDGMSGGATFGSLNTQQFFGDAALSLTDSFRIGLGGGYSGSDGMPVFTDDDSDRGWRNTTGRLNAEFDAGESLTFRARGFLATGRTEYSTQTFSDPPYEDVSPGLRKQRVFVRNRLPREQRTRHTRHGEPHARRDRPEAGQFRQHTEDPFDFAHTTRDSFDVQVDLPDFSGHALSLGVQRSGENADALSFGTAFDQDTHVTQSFIQDQFTIARVSSRLALGQVHHQTFGDETTWNAEFGVSLGESTRIVLSGGKAFRAPDATDRFGFGGNPDLQPEVSEQYELSVRQQLGVHHQLTLAAFNNGSKISSTTSSRTSTPSRAATRTSTVRASRAWNSATSSRQKAGVPARNSPCRIRATKPPTSGCCAVRASR